MFSRGFSPPGTDISSRAVDPTSRHPVPGQGYCTRTEVYSPEDSLGSIR